MNIGLRSKNIRI